jgi:carbohydrate-selective porin OprB
LRVPPGIQQHEAVAGTPVGHGQTVLEVTYQLAIAPWLVVQPDAQFFFDPAFSRRDAYALGVQMTTIF